MGSGASSPSSRDANPTPSTHPQHPTAFSQVTQIHHPPPPASAPIYNPPPLLHPEYQQMAPAYHAHVTPDIEGGSMWGHRSGHLSTSGQTELPPHTPTLPNADEETSRFLSSYGEQEFALQEMTLPRDGIDSRAYHDMAVQQALYYDSESTCSRDRNVNDRQADDEGEAFIAAMAAKRKEYDNYQEKLYEELSYSRRVDDVMLYNITEILSTFCLIHHTLYGGSEDELGIEFEPCGDAAEDAYILEQLNNLCSRHQKELHTMDENCARKLLEYSGETMDRQKLDSLLEEHIKLRYYLRTKQTHNQVEAYVEVQRRIQENPRLVPASIRAITSAGNSVETPKLSNQLDHPIVSRLPQLNHAHILQQYSRNELDESSESDSESDHEIEVGQSTEAFETGHQAVCTNAHESFQFDNADGKTGTTSFRFGMLLEPNTNFKSELENHSSDTQPHYASVKTTETPSFHTASPIAQTGFQVITANPKYIGGVSYSKATAPPTETNPSQHVSRSDSENEGPHYNHANSTVQPSVQATEPVKLHQGLDFKKHEQSQKSRLTSRQFEEEDPLADFALRNQAIAEADLLKYDDELDDDEDLIKQYENTLGVSDFDEEESDFDSRVQPAAISHESNVDRLNASQKIQEAVTDTMWEHQANMTPEKFNAMIQIWEKKEASVSSKNDDKKKVERSLSTKKLWQKASELAISSVFKDQDTEASTGEGYASQSMQTSLKAGVGVSVQTDGTSMADAVTFVDNMVTKDAITQRISTLDEQLAMDLGDPDLDEEEVTRLLREHSDRVNRLKQQRDLEQQTALQRLLGKKKSKNSKLPESDPELDEQLQANLERIDSDTRRQLLTQGRQLDEDDIQAILEESRKKQDEIIKKRHIEKVKQMEKLRQKKLDRKKKKKAMDDNEGNDPNKSYDEYFELFQQLKMCGGSKNDVYSLLDQLKSKQSPQLPLNTASAAEQEAEFERMKVKADAVKTGHMKLRKKDKELAKQKALQRRKQRQKAP